LKIQNCGGRYLGFSGLDRAIAPNLYIVANQQHTEKDERKSRGVDTDDEIIHN